MWDRLCQVVPQVLEHGLKDLGTTLRLIILAFAAAMIAVLVHHLW